MSKGAITHAKQKLKEATLTQQNVKDTQTAARK